MHIHVGRPIVLSDPARVLLERHKGHHRAADALLVRAFTERHTHRRPLPLARGERPGPLPRLEAILRIADFDGVLARRQPHETAPPSRPQPGPVDPDLCLRRCDVERQQARGDRAIGRDEQLAHLACGELEPMTDVEVARELRALLAGMDGMTAAVRSDHILNLLEEVEGQLPDDLPRIRAAVDRSLTLPDDARDPFILGRRPGTWQECDAELVKIVGDANPERDAALVRLFYRRCRRSEWLMQPVLKELTDASYQKLSL